MTPAPSILSFYFISSPLKGRNGVGGQNAVNENPREQLGHCIPRGALSGLQSKTHKTNKSRWSMFTQGVALGLLRVGLSGRTAARRRRGHPLVTVFVSGDWTYAEIAPRAAN